ncbi:S-adenosylmethionine tRNA ribosyltransferase [Porphyromonas canoris]|uniref:S-adenosylmethionine:tRNA ribosyltransferase-isomerase n=1 Tax=Porphyromonas canoris TaxID=36875 RepID=UPI00051D8A06|nr:S-adenosylmethionine:tRNA ribosyltransferase-isomerase [Porphyromonas canoris]KGL50847.1 S-adenosylmethionine tRNA ribosyltransferase [Porphyromonas canoris]
MQRQQIESIEIKSFNYDLPEERIAKYPLKERDSSKLLLFNENREIEDRSFYQLPELLPENSLLVFNNTKVIHARLHFRKETGAQIEIFCLEPLYPESYEINLSTQHEVTWICLVGNAKKWKPGTSVSLTLKDEKGKEITVYARYTPSTTPDSRNVTFTWDAPVSFSEILELAGELPIPPYLNRKTEECDSETYQTVYAKWDGSVAAPTAGLHFTPDVLEAIKQKGIKTTPVTLHVGAGTFKPVKSELISQHEMHREMIVVQRATINTLLAHLGSITAVGTTSTRTLESLYYIGVHLIENSSEPLFVAQFEPYHKSCSHTVQAALEAILKYMDANGLDQIEGHTEIMIAPGFEFRLIDRLITNFHQPQSTLLLLISAFIGGGDEWRKIYDHALKNDYRFLSYGDSSLLYRSRS